MQHQRRIRGSAQRDHLRIILLEVWSSGPMHANDAYEGMRVETTMVRNLVGEAVTAQTWRIA